MNIKANILNPADKTQLYKVASGSGHPFAFVNLANVPEGSSFTDTLNKAFYQRVAKEGAYGDWELIGGTVTKPGVYPIDGDMDVLNKRISLLQSGVSVGDDDKVRGTLQYVEGWEDFSGLPAEQSGHYVALYIPIPEGAVGKIQKNDGAEKTLDDGLLILRLTDDSDADTLKVTLTIDEETLTRTLTFTDIVKL